MALVFDIKRFSLNDGPGIRTTIFMQGCPLHCVWCHNPEGISPHPVRLYNKKKCIGCSSCVEACPHGVLRLTPDGIVGGEGCVLCGSCAEACPSRAMEMAGKEWTVEQLMAQVERERQIMTSSGGGVTLCGGEPLMHHHALLEILDAVGQAGFHRAVDTSLYAAATEVKQVMERCELLLIDLKHTDSSLHHFYTGVDNGLILSNIRLVSEAAHTYWIRIPLIVGVNADAANLQASAAFLASLPTPPEVVCLLPYHDIGKGKHARMGTTYNPAALPMREPSVEEQEAALGYFTSRGLTARIGG
ncbi:MAG: glycyl-radical enzyme activating protein [Prevotellaceae bacterium]|nr:glycyl-radical enzyme activating protein [Prevotellaceae bacterium]